MALWCQAHCQGNGHQCLVSVAMCYVIRYPPELHCCWNVQTHQCVCNTRPWMCSESQARRSETIARAMVVNVWLDLRHKIPTVRRMNCESKQCTCCSLFRCTCAGDDREREHQYTQCDHASLCKQCAILCVVILLCK